MWFLLESIEVNKYIEIVTVYIVQYWDEVTNGFEISWLYIYNISESELYSTLFVPTKNTEQNVT